MTKKRIILAVLTVVFGIGATVTEALSTYQDYKHDSEMSKKHELWDKEN